MSSLSPRGTYLQVADAIRGRIEEDEELVWLPPVSALRAECGGVSRGLVTRALKALESEGVVVSMQGRGWRVARGVDRRPLVERMRALFSEDGLTLGGEYPSEAELGERFGYSRVAVRSALAELEGAGLLESRQGHRRVVLRLPTADGDGGVR
ncbi:GntR family transcriptional regulator [Streptomyces sp. NBRC 109706]|uniref:GntR family transcriptional regulator n=1 Tax=Streptomyces sp. NBRC 109706 TaxID=1550035 RepID=UPI00078125BD|nr:GntR family transcriptional regulator [Streptomyces sp. NBRC 109706]